MNVSIRRANIEDLEEVSVLRVHVARTANLLDESVDLSNLLEHTKKYFAKHIGADDHITLLAFANGKLAGCGTVCFFTILPTYENPTGSCATIMNMYTMKNSRRMGVAQKILEEFVVIAKGRGCGRINLEASDMGRPLYEKIGFMSTVCEMEYRFEET